MKRPHARMTHLRLQTGLIVPLLGTLLAQPVQAEPWLCADGYGNKVFSYDPASAHDRNCVHHPIPTPNTFRVTPQQSAPQAQTPRPFPRVDARAQKQRDAARRQILERELARERQALAAAIQQLAEQKRLLHGARADQAGVEAALKPYASRIRLHLTNIESLEKELGHDH
jgi:hypothetical protein